MARARLGEAPSWVVRCVLATWVGLPLLTLLWFGGFLVRFLVTGIEDPPPVDLRPVLTVLHLAILGFLLRGYLVRRPLDEVERGYYRMALYAVGIFGLATTWFIGALAAGALLLHTFVLDKAVRPVDGEVPVTPEHRAWLEGRGDGRRPDGR